MNPATTCPFSLAVLATAALVAACSGQGMTPFTRIDGSDPAVTRQAGRQLDRHQHRRHQGRGHESARRRGLRHAQQGGHRLRRLQRLQGHLRLRSGTAEGESRQHAACLHRATRRARSAPASATSLTQGAEVVETTLMEGHVLMLKNAGGDLRMGPTEALRKP
jgi:hypothetical protein